MTVEILGNDQTVKNSRAARIEKRVQNKVRKSQAFLPLKLSSSLWKIQDPKKRKKWEKNMMEEEKSTFHGQFVAFLTFFMVVIPPKSE